MSFQQWDMTSPVMFVPCCRVLCSFLALFLVTNATYVHRFLPPGLELWSSMLIFLDDHACEKAPG